MVPNSGHLMVRALIYNVGAGNHGIAASLNKAKVAQEITFIGHNLTSTTHRALLDGTMDAVMHVNLKLAAKRTVKLLINRINEIPSEAGILPIEIVTRENTEGAVFGQTNFTRTT